MRGTLAVRIFSFFAFLAAGYILAGVPVIAQEKVMEKDKSYAKPYKDKAFCSGENWNNGDKVSFKEPREVTIPASGSINVDSGRNNVSFNFNIEPRFLPSGRIGTAGGQLVTPAGLYGVE